VTDRALVITPTYNERANVPTLVERVLAQDPRLEMLGRTRAAARD